MQLEELGVLSQRLLGPFWNQMNTLSIVFGCLVKHGILVFGEHFMLLWEILFQVIYHFARQTLLSQSLVNNVDIGVYKLHSFAESIFLWFGHSPRTFP